MTAVKDKHALKIDIAHHNNLVNLVLEKIT